MALTWPGVPVTAWASMRPSRSKMSCRQVAGLAHGRRKRRPDDGLRLFLHDRDQPVPQDLVAQTATPGPPVTSLPCVQETRDCPSSVDRAAASPAARWSWSGSPRSRRVRSARSPEASPERGRTGVSCSRGRGRERRWRGTILAPSRRASRSAASRRVPTDTSCRARAVIDHVRTSTSRPGTVLPNCRR